MSTDSTGKVIAVEQPLSSKEMALFFVISLIAGAVAFRMILNLFPWYDDIAISAWLHRDLGNPWWKVFKPLPNGVWRPLDNSLFWLVLGLFGAKSWALHGAAFVVHCIAATTVMTVSRTVFGLKQKWAWAAGLIFLTHAGTYGVIIYLANACDSLMTIGFLLALMAWDRWLTEQTPRQALLVACGFFFSLMSKESAVVLPVILTLWTLAKCIRWNKKTFLFVGALFFGAIAYGIIILQVQAANPSYVSEQRLTTNPLHVAMMHGSLLANAVMPYFNVLGVPGTEGMLPEPLGMVGRVGILVVLVVVVIIFFMRIEYLKIPAFLFLAASVSLSMPSLIAGPLESRFLHTAIAFLVLAVMKMGNDAPLMAKRTIAASVALFWLSLFPALYLSPTIHWHRMMAGRMKALVKESVEESANWPDNAEIAIYNHPHMTGSEDDVYYGQSFFDVYLPEKNAHLLLDETRETTDFAYRYRDGELVPME